MNSDNPETVQAEYQAGKAAFERGDYRRSVERLERARSEVELSSRLGGEVQIWLVTAYEATGQRDEAIALCRSLTRHPDLDTRQQGKRLLYILEAPRLQTRTEWLTQIPDLTGLGESTAQDRKGVAVSSPRPVAEKPPFTLEPESQDAANKQDNRFIWVALGLIVLVLGGLLWLR
jgi:tetratricopeptide (TPR) repeat protein